MEHSTFEAMEHSTLSWVEDTEFNDDFDDMLTRPQAYGFHSID